MTPTQHPRRFSRLAHLATLLLVTWNQVAQAEKIPITILHTNDLHSSFEGSGPDALWRDSDRFTEIRGHYARLACTIKSERATRTRRGEPVLLFDAGDFFGGTMFHAIGPSLAEPTSPELEFFSRMGYNAITLGNHDFDAGLLGLERMIEKAKSRGSTPPIVASNLEPLDPSKRSEKNSMVLPAHALIEIKSNLKTLKVGVLGLLAPTAIRLSRPTRDGLRFAGFKDKGAKEEASAFFKAAKISLQALQKERNPDLVVALLHGGEVDQELAKNVAGIDLIISGHTHEKYLRQEGKTIIAQAGAFGEALGRIEIVYDTESKTVALANPKAQADHLIPMDDKACRDKGELTTVQSLKRAASRIVGAEYDKAIFTARTDYPFIHESQLPLGRFVWSRVRTALNRRLGKPVDVYLGTLGALRGEIRVKDKDKGTPLQYSDTFRLLSLGFETLPAAKRGERRDIVPGSPLVLFYLRKSEFKTLLELLEFIGKFKKVAIPATSDNVNYTTRWWGIPLLNRLGDFTIDGKSLDELPDLVSVATTSYIAGFFADLKGLSYGLIRIQPRDAYDNPVKKLKIIDVPREYQLLAEALEEKGAEGGAR
jgi:hypothetical protein